MLKFEVYHIGSEHDNITMSNFISTIVTHSSFEYKRAFYKFPKAGMDLNQYREIIEVPQDKVNESFQEQD